MAAAVGIRCLSGCDGTIHHVHVITAVPGQNGASEQALQTRVLRAQRMRLQASHCVLRKAQSRAKCCLSTQSGVRSALPAWHFMHACTGAHACWCHADRLHKLHLDPRNFASLCGSDGQSSICARQGSCEAHLGGCLGVGGTASGTGVERRSLPALNGRVRAGGLLRRPGTLAAQLRVEALRGLQLRRRAPLTSHALLLLRGGPAERLLALWDAPGLLSSRGHVALHFGRQPHDCENRRGGTV